MRSDGLQNPLEGSAKLHGLPRGQADGIIIDAVEGVVNDDAGAVIPLGDHAKRAEVKKVEEVLDELIGEEDPLSLLHKGDDLLLEEGQVFSGGLVGASVLAASSLSCVHAGAVVKGTKGHGGGGDPAAGQSGGGAGQNQREGGNPG